MRLGLVLGYSGKKINLPFALIERAESLGFDSVWTSEAYGSDAVSVASWVLARTKRIRVGTAIMQIPARTPAACAMTAMSLAQLSNNRFILGLGASGPQVVEGWHGQPYAKPLKRTREYIAIVRKILAREEAVCFDGEHYQLPYRGEGSLGLGKPLKSILSAAPSIPIYTASITPAGLRLAGEVADGVFPIWMDPQRFDVLSPYLEAGFAKVGGSKGLSTFDVAPFVPVFMGDDLELCRMPVRQHLALYIGGMGAKGKNFYHDYAIALGYEEAAHRIQALYLVGKKQEAADEVPNELTDAMALVGPQPRIKERLQSWKEAGRNHQVGSMLIRTSQPEAMQLLADELL
ncbi:MAG: LLM class F420-dependent oxidoreductase [Pseudomonadales bacterium]|nr:LLM class F420-dependent oxidoreductase [Pseudomonadales bacterium]